MILNADLHANGIESGVKKYSGYSKGASSLSINSKTIAMPTLPQRDIYKILIKKNMEQFNNKKNIECKKNNHHEQALKQKHWSSLYVDNVLARFPDLNEYVCAAGISPSGTIHFGNFRDVITAYAVYNELKQRGKKVKMIFSWDDFDRFRKVPKGIDPSFEKYIGLPLTEVPSPDGILGSYAEYQEKEFERTMKEMGIDMEYRYQTDEYKSGKYDDQIIEALQNRKQLAEIMLSFMTEKGKENRGIVDNEYINDYYPISVYSSFTGKDNTKILNYDGDKIITYKCYDSGKEESIDITKKRNVKLAWKVDWAMRWKHENVVFEPGGKDHSSPGGSYDTSSVISKKIFDRDPPVYQGYDFVGIRGVAGKMSGSSGEAISPGELLRIYTPELLKWMYFKNDPSKTFSLAFDSEVYRQYAEFDEAIGKYNNDSEELSDLDKRALELSGIKKEDNPKDKLPFRQAVAFGQIVQWNKEKLLHILKALNFDYDIDSINERLGKAKKWLETYNQDEIIELNKVKNSDFIKNMTEEEKNNVRLLKSKLEDSKELDIDELTAIVYGIVKKDNMDKKEQIKAQADFFKIIYNLLIGKNKGPRLSTFLWAIEDKEKILELLDV